VLIIKYQFASGLFVMLVGQAAQKLLGCVGQLLLLLLQSCNVLLVVNQVVSVTNLLQRHLSQSRSVFSHSPQSVFCL